MAGGAGGSHGILLDMRPPTPPSLRAAMLLEPAASPQLAPAGAILDMRPSPARQTSPTAAALLTPVTGPGERVPRDGIWCGHYRRCGSQERTRQR